MKIILEDKDVILFTEKSTLVHKEWKGYSTDCTCSIGEGDGKGVNWKIQNIPANVLFGEICNTSNQAVLDDIKGYISSLFGFRMSEEEQTESIYVKQSKKGIVLEINNKLFTPEELKEAAMGYADSCIPEIRE